MASTDDRLSELSDDLLRRVLHFAPSKEAASTAALSRRWRAPLWLSSGAVNLETGVRCVHDNCNARCRRDAFLSAAVEALDAADVPVTRLSLRLEFDLDEPVGDYLDRYRYCVQSNSSLVQLVLSHRAARRVEELRLAATGLSSGFKVTVDSLPMENLRVLELYNCKGLYQSKAAALAFPRLLSLTLKYCHQNLSSLQSILDAASAIAVIRLESVYLDATPPRPREAPTRRRLCCPAVTVLVLDEYWWEEEKTPDGVELELETPRLRRFRYQGRLRSISFTPRPLELEQVDLKLLRFGYGTENNDPNRDLLATFWQFARSFASTKQMRLRVNHLEEIAVLDEASRVKLLPAFRRLERLEVQGAHWTKHKTAAAMAILNLLSCCPVLCALRINLTPEAEHKDASDEKTRIPRKEIHMAALFGPYQLLECMQRSLKRVALKFRADKSNCLGANLVEFFAKNAMVLEEMHIDGGGDDKLCGNINRKAEKWNSKRKKLGETCFVVLPLKS